MERFGWATALIIVGSLACSHANAQGTRYSGTAQPLTTSGDEKRFIHAMSEIMADGQMQVDRMAAQFQLIASVPIELSALAHQLAQYGITLSALKSIPDHQAAEAPEPRDLRTNDRLSNADTNK